METTGTMTFTRDIVNGDTITRSSGSWIDQGYAAGDFIVVKIGDETKPYIIRSITALALTLQEKGLITEGTDLTNAKVYADRADSITRNTGSWIADGFEPGLAIVVTGAVNNNGTYEIKSVTDSKLTLLQSYGLNNEIKTGASVTADTNDTIRRSTGS